MKNTISISVHDGPNAPRFELKRWVSENDTVMYSMTLYTLRNMGTHLFWDRSLFGTSLERPIILGNALRVCGVDLWLDDKDIQELNRWLIGEFGIIQGA